MRKQIVIVGFGMVAHRVCEKLCSHPSFAESGLGITVVGEEKHLAYDRVHLTEGFDKSRDLSLADEQWYSERNIELRLGSSVTEIDREEKFLRLAHGDGLAYDILILATGSAPFVPPIQGKDLPGVFVYRTVDDLRAIEAYAEGCSRATVLGGGLLGLEAARALANFQLDTQVVEFAPRLMPRQLDDGGAGFLKGSIENMGIRVLCDHALVAVLGHEKVESLTFANGKTLATDMLVISAGIKPRDELARAAGLEIGTRGGILTDGRCQTSDPFIYAVGECAAMQDRLFGLVAPCYRMVDVLVEGYFGRVMDFDPGDGSTRLKLMGVEVASIGDPFVQGSDVAFIQVQHEGEGIYKKLVYNRVQKKVLGAVLVGDSVVFGQILQALNSGQKIDFPVENLLIPGAPMGNGAKASGASMVCSCENISAAAIEAAIDGGCANVKAIKTCTRAGTGCGSCVPLLQEMLDARASDEKRRLCPHIPMTRPELFQLMKATRIKSFAELMQRLDEPALGCEICKPTVASILASLWNEYILEPGLDVLQDTNDRYLANIQVNGSYSIVPRIPAGEITAQKLMAIAAIAMKYDLYTKITGGQRIDLFGARLERLPAIWKDLVEAGFESGHAYGKAVRTVKSCVGSTWCRYGVQDSVAMAIRVEERYKGIRAPHKIKMAVSGCARECAEAQSKDVGVIATEKGWNLYVAGNGGMRPAHAQLFATDLSDEDLIRYIDRFLMYYIRTADRLTRTAPWLQKLPGGMEHLQDVLIRDSFGICAELEAEMESLVGTYQCEWRSTLQNPDKLKAFRPFVNSGEKDESIQFMEERGQIRPLMVRSQ